MSTIRSDVAAERVSVAASLVAAALREAAAGTRTTQRIFLPRWLGLEPTDVFKALEADFDPTPAIEIATPTGTFSLLGVDTLGSVLVPYLVRRTDNSDVTAEKPNCGSAGFAARLRDDVHLSVDGRPVLLLVLDPEPVDTVLTAATDGRLLQGLSWKSLVMRAVSSLTVPPAATDLVADLLERDRLPHDAEHLGALLEVLRDSTSDSDLGTKLWRLGCYVADPQLSVAAPQRLKRSATWRERLDRWSAPGQDLAERLTAEYGDATAPGRQKILEALTAFGLNYDAFTLEELPEAPPKDRLTIARPLRVRGAVAVAGRDGLVVWLPGGGTFAILLKGTAGKSDQAIVRWRSSAPSDVEIDAGRHELRVHCAATADWLFGTILMGQADSLPVAVFTGEGTWFPAESSFEIDVEAGCFRYEGEPRVVAVDATGTVVSAPLIQPLSDVESGESVPYEAIWDNETHMIFLIDVGETGYEPTEDPDGEPPDEDKDPSEDPDEPGDDDGDGDANPPGGQDDSGRGSSRTRMAEFFSSVPHAKLEVARRRVDTDLGDVTFGVASGLGHIGVGGSLPKLFPQTLTIGGSRVDGLDLERQVLALPEATAYTAKRRDGEFLLQPDPLLERLSLEDMGEVELDEFWRARRDMFVALAPHGSVHALAAGAAREEAKRYVAAYSQMLERAASGGPFRGEYQRLVLCDAITDIDSDEILLAPTNPLTVAFLLRFDEKITSWLPRAAEVLAADIKSCSIRHLLPTFALGDTWYEPTGDVPLLWRRYRQLLSLTNGGDSDAGYITRRLGHFLDVFPAYKDPRQVIAVSFVEPGDGGSVLAALRKFYEPLVRIGTGEPLADLPSLDVTVVTSLRPESLERAMSATDELVDAVMRDRVSLTVVGPEEQRPEFAHLTFIFRSPLRRQPATIDIAARASTLYVEGLAAAPGRLTTPGRNETQFAWGTFAGQETGPGDSLEGLIRATLEIVGGMPGDQIVANHTKMPSTRVATGFLTEIYARSVWVVHLDRLLGLEAFAPDALEDQRRYLIDYEDRAEPGQAGLDAITATERVDPYHLALRKVMRELGNPTAAALDYILRLLNGVNGKWALDLLGAGPTRIRERVGLVASIAAICELDGAFEENADSFTVMLALDEVLDALPTDGRSRPLGKHCDDLLVLTVPVAEGRVKISGRLLEVKYRSVSDAELPALARAQLETALEWLHSKFNTDGPSRLFRARDLSELIRGGMARGQAFHLTSAAPESANAVEDVLERVSRGDFDLDLSFDVGARRFHAEFISVEADSGFAASRQPLPGTGHPLSWLRLGRPVLEALAAGADLPRPSNFLRATVPSALPPDEPDGPIGDGPNDLPQPPDGPAGSSPTESLEDNPAESPQANMPDGYTASMRRPDPSTDPETLRITSELTQATAKYGLNVEPFDPARAEIGPSIVRVRTRLLGRQTLAGLQSRALDLGREVGVAAGLIIDQEPYYVTVDVPRTVRETVSYSDYAQLLDTPTEPGALNFLLGVAPSGEVRTADLARLPHLLVAGATGSGKSVLLRALVSSLVRTRNSVGLQLLICDPQTVNYEPFEGSMHLVGGRIVTDPLEMVEQLTETLSRELDSRRSTLRAARVTSALEFYEDGGTLEELPQMVIIIDEFADLVDALERDARNRFMQNVKRFAQMSRALGIYLVLATQRPSVQVITGDIKANLTARVALRMLASQDSMTILGRGGAESLLDKGDLLFDHAGRLEHLQGFYCAPRDAFAEVERWQAD